MKEDDPIEKINISLSKFLFSLKNNDIYPSTDIEPDYNIENNENIQDIQEDEDLLNEYEHLGYINGNNSNIKLSNTNLNNNLISPKYSGGNNQMPNDNNNSNRYKGKLSSNKKIYFKSKFNNPSILFKKIRELKKENENWRHEVREYQNEFKQIVQIIINGISTKDM